MLEVRELLRRIRELSRDGRPAVIATIVAVEGSAYRREGARLLLEPDGAMTGVLSGGCVERELLAPARETLAEDAPRTLRFDLSADEEAIWGFGLGCSGAITLLLEPLAAAAATVERAFAAVIEQRRTARLVTRIETGERTRVARELALADAMPPGEPLVSVLRDGNDIELHETLLPPVHLVVLGGERDVTPLARLAAGLGWTVTVVDARPTADAEARVAPFARYVGAAPRQLGEAVALDARTAVLVATHRYLDDLAYLGELAETGLGYLGLLGPAQRRERLLADLARQRGADLTPTLHGPAGLDLGGRTPEEIALAVIAEAQAALHGGSGRPLAGKASRSDAGLVERRP